MGIIDTARKLAKEKGAIPPIRIKSLEKIGSIIQTLIKDRKALEVAIDIRVQKFYTNRIIKADIFRGRPCLVIDTVLPEEQGRRALKTSEYIEISFSRGGDPYTFKSKFLRMSDESFSTVTISYPQAILLHQFRTAERFVFTPDETPVFANVEYRINKNTMGREVGLVLDLSVDGLSFSTPNIRLEPGKELEVDVEFPGYSPIGARAVVMKLSPVENQDFPLKCGIRFKGLSESRKERVSRFIQKEKHNRAGHKGDIYDINRITNIALNRATIKARLAGRKVKKEELEELTDLLEFKNIRLDESLDL